MDSIFTRKFWIDQWQKDKDSDTYQVHKGYSAPDYWNKAAPAYDQDEDELSCKRLDKALRLLRDNGLLFEGMKVLDIGCGTGRLAMALARHGATVTALDFSTGMLEQFRLGLAQEENSSLRSRITLMQADWHEIDINEKGWQKQFDLVAAFMSPGVATPEAFDKMMACSKKGCAVKGWADKKAHPILAGLWQQIMGSPLEDKPQSILFKINLIISLGFFPDITFDEVKWHQDTTVDEEFDRQLALFGKLGVKSPEKLEGQIRTFLESIADDNGRITRTHKGMTATVVWNLDL